MMPQRIPARKIICNDCGWKKSEPAVTIGDARTPADITRTTPVKSCPKCGSSNVTTKNKTSFMDIINPSPFGGIGL